MGKHSAASAIDLGIESPPDFTYRPLDWLIARVNPRNPKDHDVGEIVQSILRHGFVGAVTLDAESETLVAGHGRLKALVAIRNDGHDAPDRIIAPVNSPDDWLIPTHVKFFADDNERDAYTIGDNQTTIKGGWEEAKLVEMLAGLAKADPVSGLVGTGFDGDDLDALTALLTTESLTSEGYGGGEKEETPSFGVIVHVEDAEEERTLQRLLKTQGYTAKRLSDGQ